MTSFQITLTPSRRAAASFIGSVRRSIQKALVDVRAKSGISQADIARTIGVHRSVINREVIGHKDMTLGRVAEIASALGLEPHFELREPITDWKFNSVPMSVSDSAVKKVTIKEVTGGGTKVLVSQKAAT